MKNQGRLIILSIAASWSLTGCLDNLGGSEVSSQSNNSSEFIVEAPPAENTQQTTGGDAAAALPAPGNDLSGAPQIIRGLIINDNASVTGNRELSLRFDPPFMSAYTKLTANLDCVGGAWEDFVDQKSYPSTQGGVVTLSAQFRDFDGRTSRCYAQSIVIDEEGPEILFSQYPVSSVEEGSDVDIVYSVTDLYSDVSQVTCEFLGVQKACAAGTATVKFPSMVAGDYVFKIIAQDASGNSSNKSIGFKVTSMYKRMAHSVQVNQYNKVDILFVIDNSGSMEYEQRNMALRVRNFLDVVKGLDWQIGITTTDPVSSTWGDGRLLAMKGLSSTYILHSGMPETTAREALSQTLQRTETGSGQEQGIYATYRVLERGQAGPGVNRDLIREGSQLAVVLISDEDESANQFRNDPTNLVNYIRSTYGGQKAFSFHSIITRPGDRACKSTYGYTEGFRYQTLSQLTGGVIGDVCALDYAAQVQGIAEGVRNTLKTVTLACEPIIDSVRTMVIKKDGQNYSGGYTISGVNMVFNEMLPAGSYSLEYSCLR